MEQEKKSSKDRTNGNAFWTFIRKNGLNIAMGIVVVILLVSPDAKAWTLKQLMRTGLFNASIEEKHTGTSDIVGVDFQFEDENGEVRRLSSLRGKVVFVNFWASWCPPCRAEFPSIQALHSKFGNNPDIFFLMMNEDRERSAATNYLDQEGYEFPVYRSRGPVPEEIYTGTLPTTIVLDKKGRIRMHHTGFANYSSRKFLEQIEALIAEL